MTWRFVVPLYRQLRTIIVNLGSIYANIFSLSPLALHYSPGPIQLLPQKEERGMYLPMGRAVLRTCWFVAAHFFTSSPHVLTGNNITPTERLLQHITSCFQHVDWDA